MYIKLIKHTPANCTPNNPDIRALKSLSLLFTTQPNETF